MYSITSMYLCIHISYLLTFYNHVYIYICICILDIIDKISTHKNKQPVSIMNHEVIKFPGYEHQFQTSKANGAVPRPNGTCWDLDPAAVSLCDMVSIKIDD